MTEHEADSFEHAGIPVKIFYDPHPNDPRGWRDSLTTYVWADKNHIAQKHDEQIDLDRFWTEDRKWTSVALAARWLTLFDWPTNAIAVPFQIDDYGSNGSRAYITDVDNDSCTGFIVILKSELEKELALSPDWDVMEYIKAEFGEFASWIEGEVYGFVVAEGDEDMDSCWGFYGDMDYVISQAKESAECIAHERWLDVEPPDVAEVLQ